MSALSDWFRKKTKPAAPQPRGAGDWRKEVEALEREAERTSRAFQGTPLNKAGDICLRAGERDVALTLYGRAIDALLEDGQREAARGVANKIIRVHPGAIRTLCTLTWLDLAARHMATALLHLRDYVEAAKKGGQEFLTAEQIFLMASVAPQEEFLAAAADALDNLGFADRASTVRDWVASGGSPNRITHPDELATHCLRTAVGVNKKGRGSR
jgi:tetratricopeptide (TPR) repeat protein